MARSVKPTMPLRGVRMSWLTAPKKAWRALLASMAAVSSACWMASFFSVSRRRMMMISAATETASSSPATMATVATIETGSRSKTLARSAESSRVSLAMSWLMYPPSTVMVLLRMDLRVLPSVP